MTNVDRRLLDNLIQEFADSGGAEMSNTHLFIERLCEALALPKPDPAKEQNHLNDYVFERSVNFKHADGTQTKGRIDLYKRDCFILEAKQSAKRVSRKYNPDQHELILEDRLSIKAGPARRGTRGWDTVMIEARKQAENYARALPVDHGYPPFLLIADIGHVIEIYADFSGQGKNYAHFPDRRSYRISLEDLRDEVVQERLRAIWAQPLTLDPARISAEVTRDIADRLAIIAKRLEKKHDSKEVAGFLMRCLFTMFAEDVGLLPKKSFTDLLGRMKTTPHHFKSALEDLWTVMDSGGYFGAFNHTLMHFNGSLFKERHAISLEHDDIHELWVAAKRDWQHVEPAIFGTLLERALDARERSKLGAHYTPRAFVERLVIPTLIDPLRREWEEVLAHVEELLADKQDDDALAAVKAYHHRLCSVRVLDPACGTGNFLYVSLELMKRLEGEVIEILERLGVTQARLGLEGETVNPSQFLGLELNPRAVPIADLVLWIGFLKWQLKTSGLKAIVEPVLHAYGTIKEQDAILAYDSRYPKTDEHGEPLTRWDGYTTKLHPVTGEDVPDPAARLPVFTYSNPHSAEWPEADYIVGNPPFIGGGVMRSELGDGYAEACWKARPKVPAKADFVMHFWDIAATRLHDPDTKLKRFGFITTNSITQTFSQRVLERHMTSKSPLSLVYAIPDHPWLKAADKAAVRIAMTVAEVGRKTGTLANVISETSLNTDTPIVGMKKNEGSISSNFEIASLSRPIQKLMANADLCRNGMMLAGKGFLLPIANKPPGKTDYEKSFIKRYVNGGDLTDKLKEKFVIDTYNGDLKSIREKAPTIYQYLFDNVKPFRDSSRDEAFKEKWWLFGRNRPDLRIAVSLLPRFIATTETAKHRFFQFLPSDVLPDHMVVAIAIEDAACLSILSSRIHALWAFKSGGWMGVGNDSRYTKSRCFDPFPFPDFSRLTPSLLTRLRKLGDELDRFRKDRLASHKQLTMTGMYNVMDRERELDHGCSVAPLSAKEKDIHQAALISILKETHDAVDQATFEAYGWDDLAAALIGKPGGLTPSPHKTAEQRKAEDELFARLAALNLERAEKEKRGEVLWLRPEYQIPKLRHKVSNGRMGEQMEAGMSAAITNTSLPRWPIDGLEQIRVIRDALTKSSSPVDPESLSKSFAGRNTAKRRERVAKVLETLAMTGSARRSDDRRFFIPHQ